MAGEKPPARQVPKVTAGVGTAKAWGAFLTWGLCLQALGAASQTVDMQGAELPRSGIGCQSEDSGCAAQEEGPHMTPCAGGSEGHSLSVTEKQLGLALLQEGKS